MTVVVSASDRIEEMLGDIDYDPEELGLYPFMVRVGCVKMAAPRHERFEYLINFGQSHVSSVFNGTPLGSEMLFMFPERFMSVHEQQQFMSTLKKHPSAEGFTKVDIITSSPLIIGNFMRQMIRILTWEDDALHDGTPQWKEAA